MPEINQQNLNKKGRLGRGLGSLLGGDSAPSHLEKQEHMNTQGIHVNTQTQKLPAAEVTKIDESSQIWKISIDKIHPNPRQPRKQFLSDRLNDLAASIKEKGILQPITARRVDESRFEIIAGERRWRAAQLAGLHEVPVILKKVGDQDSLELAIIENIQRADLNPMEESEAYDRLLTDYGLTQQEIAQKVGKERATIANALRLLVLPAEVKVLLRKGEISSGHAKALLSLTDPSAQIALALRSVAEKLSVRAVEKLASKKPISRVEEKLGPGLGLDVSKRLVEGLSQELQKLLGTKVTIDYDGGKGKIGISFYSDDELTQTVEKIRKAWAK